MDVRSTEAPAEPIEDTREESFAPADTSTVALEDHAAPGPEEAASAGPDPDWRSRLWKSRAVFWNWE